MIVRRLVFLVAFLSIGVWIACSGNGPTGGTFSANPGTVNVTVSDPPSCSLASSTSTTSPNTFSHVYVTITDVQINASSTAGASDSSWIDLTPSLKSSPKQVDLLGLADNQCFLATLGSGTQLQAGSYQQIRIILAPNNTQVSGNACGTAGANCVVPSSGGPQPLQLSSEATTGIKIPSGQIAGGSFTIGAGQTKDLNIDFNTCASIVTQGAGVYRLKPVLHAGEVSLTSSSINGKLVDKSTGQAINGTMIVALEQKDSAGIDRVIMQTTPDATGSFVFCPVPAGTYDVVATAVDASNNAYAATVTTGVQPGNALGNVQMIAVTPVTTGTGGTTVTTSTAPATLAGTVSSVNSSSNGTAIDASLSALQQVSSGTSSTLTFTIPVSAQSATLAIATVKPSTCTTTTCPPYTATYTFTLPPVNPTFGAWASSGTAYAAGAAGQAAYTVEGQAFVPQSGGTSDCSPSTLTTASTTVTAGASTNAPTLAFSSCQ